MLTICSDVYPSREWVLFLFSTPFYWHTSEIINGALEAKKKKANLFLSSPITFLCIFWAKWIINHIFFIVFSASRCVCDPVGSGQEIPGGYFSDTQLVSIGAYSPPRATHTRVHERHCGRSILEPPSILHRVATISSCGSALNLVTPLTVNLLGLVSWYLT